MRPGWQQPRSKQGYYLLRIQLLRVLREEVFRRCTQFYVINIPSCFRYDNHRVWHVRWSVFGNVQGNSEEKGEKCALFDFVFRLFLALSIYVMSASREKK